MSLPEYLVVGEPARLIPVVSDTSKEVRAASIVLATLQVVPPFANVMLGSLGQRLGTRASVDCYTEVVFRGSTEKARPDGLIVVDGGRGRMWRCLIETKVGRAELETAQVERYLALAKSQSIDAVLTVSNQFVALPTHSPVRIAKAMLRGVDLFHWSWMNLLTQAMLLVEDRIAQAEQRYILSEMIRYLSHPSVGVTRFDRMNAEWKDLNAQVQAGARLNRALPNVENSVAAWHQEVRDLCLLMTRKVGRPVRIRLSRAHTDDPTQRLKDDCAHLAEKHELACHFDVPDAASPIKVAVDLQRRTVSASMTLVAPQDKRRASSRINWVLRQLAKAKPDGLHVKALWPGRAPATQCDLTAIRLNPELLEAENNKDMVPSQFEVLLIRDLAGKFGGARTFIDGLEEAVRYFYEQVGQHLRAYVAPPPRLRKDDGKGESEAEANADLVDVVSSSPIVEPPLRETAEPLLDGAYIPGSSNADESRDDLDGHDDGLAEDERPA
jgi:hypothetical protein